MEEFALFSSQRNKIMVVSKDHEILKHTQFLTMNTELLYLVSLNGISNYRKNLLTNKNCMTIGIATGEKMRIEVDMYFTNPSYRLITEVAAVTQQDKNYQTNLLFVGEIIKSLKDVKDKVSADTKNQVDILIKGLRGFHRFVELTVPNDPELYKLIEKEISNKKKVLDLFDEFTGEVYNILLKLDYHMPLPEIKKSIADQVAKIPPKCYYFAASTELLLESLNEPS